jgi:hypothetical protein
MHVLIHEYIVSNFFELGGRITNIPPKSRTQQTKYGFCPAEISPREQHVNSVATGVQAGATSFLVSPLSGQFRSLSTCFLGSYPRIWSGKRVLSP